MQFTTRERALKVLKRLALHQAYNDQLKCPTCNGLMIPRIEKQQVYLQCRECGQEQHAIPFSFQHNLHLDEAGDQYALAPM